MDILIDLEINYSKDLLNQRLHKRHKSHNRDWDYSKNFITKEFPQGILIIQHNSKNSGFKKLVTLLEEIVKPKIETIEAIEQQFGQKIESFNEFRD
jgi:hypothetical protein